MGEGIETEPRSSGAAEQGGKARGRKARASPPAPAAEELSVPLTWVRALDEAQPRAALDPIVVGNYVEIWRSASDAGDHRPFPPIVAFGVKGKTSCYLADGFHRLEAARQAGKAQIRVAMTWAATDDAARSQAVWHAAGANARHGLPRTNADKRTAVAMALAHEQGRGLSDALIAEHCGVSDRLVAMVRRERTPNGSGLESEARRGRDGKVRRVRAAADGIVPEALALVAETAVADEPAKLRQIARLAPERQLEVAQQLVEGRSLSAAKRTATDDYPTPRRAVWPLLQAYGDELRAAAKRGTFLEPAAGSGELVDHVDRAIPPKGWDVVDIRLPQALQDAGTRIGFEIGGGWDHSLEAADFLERGARKKKAAACIMNPPYSLAAAFVEKALREAELVFALLPLTFLASQEREQLLDEHPPRVCILPERPSFTGDGATDAMDYAWFVWGDRRPGTWARLKVAPPEVLDDDPAVDEARAFELDEAMEKISRKAGSCIARVKVPPATEPCGHRFVGKSGVDLSGTPCELPSGHEGSHATGGLRKTVTWARDDELEPEVRSDRRRLAKGEQLDLEVEAAKAAELRLAKQVDEAARGKRRGGKR